ncbi:MFS general substrate transporter [Sistotremastrum niveocremeum HHB9708]|uniref:MFS general substrate transporter n=1 Tax=Sistotremastrum niveocremeum HHB9708 TaxID=1314777 RepID=A0A164XI75_9AGAM|nr:MFS general substrate transporter [Sistotremastrum niveocremeum HHB9708]
MALHAGSSSYTSPLELRRYGTLVGSTLVALASGTNYLGTRLRISNTQLNIIVGVYFSGPVWGRIVDRRGPRILLASGFIMLLIGYSGIRLFYDHGDSITKLGQPGLSLLVFCSFLTGFGGNGGLTASMNATAKSFPDRLRATTTGIVISGFGLSAFFFSTIAKVFFAHSTSSLLLLLSLGTSLPMIMGFFVVRPVPHAERPDDDEAFLHAGRQDYTAVSQSEIYEVPERNRVIEMSPSRSPPLPKSFPRTAESTALADIHGKTLLTSFDFWLLATITVFLSGTGLMYINNVGAMTKALYAHGNPEFNEAEAARYQGEQVSTISVANFLGRIIIGFSADFAKSKLGFPRSFGAAIIALGFVASQVAASRIEVLDRLWIASFILGLSYGGLFGLFPTITVDWFGLAHFSENWGFVSVSPAIGGNLFSLAFGRNLDAHDPTLASPAGEVSGRAIGDAAHQCLQGLTCYVDTLKLTIAACSLAFLLSLLAGWREWRRRKDESSVVWDAGADE